MPPPNQPPAASELTEWHLLGLLKDEQVDVLNDLLLRDAEARQHCVLVFETMSMVHEEFRRREENAEMHAGEPLLKDFDEVFSDLLQAEQSAEVGLHSELAKKPAQNRAREADSLSFRDYIAVGGYAARKALLSKPMIHAGIGAAIAAVLLLGLFLFNPFASDAPASIAEGPNPSPQPSVAAGVPANTVATLTAQHNATWAEGALAPGFELRAGTRLTLTTGFAEITTSDGALAILEAPAMIELLENKNAIRLHAGKLVGICETESSKGFLVRTPHMDITDLGTRFGVDASDTSATQVHVLEGEVQLASNSGTFSTERLRAGESARGSSIVSQLVRITFDPSLFDAPALGAVAHLGTGQNLAPGTADPDWRIVAIDGMALDQPVMAEVADPSKFTNTIRENLRFMPNVPSRSQWITLPDSIDFANTQDTVTYQTRFDTTGLDLSTLQATLRFVADNQIKSIGLNGQMLRVPPHATDTDYTRMTAITLEQGLVEGENTLTFTVRRYRTKTTNYYWTGLRTELELIDRRLRVEPSE